MTTAADIMSQGAQCIPMSESLDRAAQLMREQNVGALPVCDESERMQGIITDRDIVVKCVAAGHDPSRVRAGDLCEGTPRWISADAGASDVLSEMETHQIRRLPVVDGDKRLVGMISEADVARTLDDDQVATFVERVYATS